MQQKEGYVYDRFLQKNTNNYVVAVGTISVADPDP